jgi:avidin family protein
MSRKHYYDVWIEVGNSTREVAGMSRFILALLLFVGASASAFAQSVPVPSYWLNQRGSEMKLYPTVPPWLGSFNGIYMNHAAGFKCQASPTNPPYQLTGRARGAYVTFKVVWDNGVQNCNSTAVWHGRVVGKTIITHWILFGPGIVPPLRGVDVFQQQP